MERISQLGLVIITVVLCSCGMQELAEDARDLSAQANEGVAESNQTSREMLLHSVEFEEQAVSTINAPNAAAADVVLLGIEQC